MSDSEKIKVYKNPARNRPEAHKNYVPQHQLLGVEPTAYKSPMLPSNTIAVQQNVDNARSPRPLIRQPYAETITSPIGRGKGPLPNVGNNVEQTWSSVDGEIIDDISGVDFDPPIKSNDAPFLTQSVLEGAVKNGDLLESIKELEEDLYLLIVHDNHICAGPLQYIEEQTTLLVFGEHELYAGIPISTDDIIILKKVKLKVGVFLS